MPDINFKCPRCAQAVEAPSDLAGRMVVCPLCQKQISVPRGMQQSAVKSLSPNTDKSTAVVWLSVLGGMATFLAILFGLLWLSAIGREPRVIEKSVQVVKEVPVVSVKEVEVPVKLTPLQQVDLEMGARCRNAIYCTDQKQLFRNVGSVDVHVFLNDPVKSIISEDRIKNKLELILRRNNITIDNNSLHSLWLSVEGTWLEEKVGLSYIMKIDFRTPVLVERQLFMYRSTADIWSKGSIGFAGKSVVEKALIDGVENEAEAFANAYLSEQKK